MTSESAMRNNWLIVPSRPAFLDMSSQAISSPMKIVIFLTLPERPRLRTMSRRNMREIMAL